MYERRTFVMEDAQFEVLFDFIFENKTYIVYTNYHMNKFGKTELFAADCRIESISHQDIAQ